jgi:hypothetical protein
VRFIYHAAAAARQSISIAIDVTGSVKPPPLLAA